MTVSSTLRKAGPFNGNGVTTAFPFTFKVFAKTDIQVVKTAATGVQTTLVLDSDYSVVLNADQDASPGGTITYPVVGSPLAAGSKLDVIGSLDYEQTTDITNLGKFLPQVHENALDYLTILVQQLLEKQGRSLLLPVGETSAALATAANRLDRLLGFNVVSGSAEISTFTMTQVASVVAAVYAAAAGPLDALSFLQSGLGAVSRTGQDKMRDVVSVKDFGAKGDGVTDDTAAIVAAIATHPAALFFPKGSYRTTAVITVGTDGPLLFGVNGRYNNSSVSRLKIDHAGTGIHFENQSGLGAGLNNMVVERAAGFAGQGTNVSIDSLGSGPSSIVSHTDMDACYIVGGAVGLLMRGLIFGRIGRVTVSAATTGLSMPGAGAAYNGCNIVGFEHISFQSCTTAMSLAGDCGSGLQFEQLDIESCTDTISIAAGCTVNGITIANLWLEANTNPMKLRAGSHITIRNFRNNNNAGIPLIEASSFGARFVEIIGVRGSSSDAAVGPAGVTVRNYEIITSGGWALAASNFNGGGANGAEVVPSVSAGKVAGASALDVHMQSGRLGKNYLVDWNIPAAGSWNIAAATNMAVETDPLGGNTAYSWTGYAFGACTGLPAVANGQFYEMPVWVKGTGRLKLANYGRTFYYDVDIAYWQRLVFRVLIEDAATQPADGLNITLTPTTTGSLKVWRPGVYGTLDSIDTRPSAASGVYEGGYIDLATYVAGAREGTRLVLRGTAAPVAGTYMVGDKVVHSAPAASGNIGWVCTTAGTPGTWKTYGSIAA